MTRKLFLPYEPEIYTMTFIAVLASAILGIFTGRLVYFMTQAKELTVGPQYNFKKEKV